MPFLALHRGSKQRGIQTFARAKLLPDPLREVELEYLDMRDWYVNQIGLIAQFEEALSQAKAAKDTEHVTEIQNRVHGAQSKLQDVKNRVRMAGERSWAEAFFLAANHMLPPDVREAISLEADNLLGRQRHELKKLG